MTRTLAGLLGLALGIALTGGPAAAQDSPATVVDLSTWDRDGGTQGRDGVEVAEGDDGDTITYSVVETPDSSTGDATTAVYPPAPAAPDLSRVPVPADSGAASLAPPTGEPVSAPVDGAPASGVPGDATLADPSGETAPAVAACGDFATWYDAQVYYESAGGAGAAPELVSSLDPNGDGVACEEMMQVS